MAKKKLNYTEGTCFLVPLRKGGFGRGVVARMNGRGVVFGYFFGPKFLKKDDAIIDSALCPQKAILLGKFGDLGFMNGEWPVIGKIEPWVRADWPLPSLFQKDLLRQNIGFIRCYDDNSLGFAREERVKLGEIDAGKLPKDGLSGYGALEIRLTKLLG
jgi:hypothetical protein